MFKIGKDVQQTVMVFVNQMLAHFWEEGCLDAVERDVPIKVASAGVSPEALNREFGEEAVARARVAWKILINQISYPTILKLIIAAGSPSEGWPIFKKFYAPQAADEKARLTQSRYSLRMKEHEPLDEYFARDSVLRSRLALHGVTFSGVDANQHFARNLSHVFGVQKSILLSNADLTCKALEEVVLNAYGEMVMAREEEKRTGTGHALVAPDWSGRGNGGDPNGGRGGRGNRGKSRKNGNKGGQQQQQQQQQQQHASGRGRGGCSEAPQQWGAGGRGTGGREGGGRYVGGRAPAVGGRGRGLPSYPPPRGGYNYAGYPPNLPRPFGNQPPIFGADPRKRCETCNALGHTHQFCAWRVDPGYPIPPPVPAGPAPPRPRRTAPGPSGYQQPWPHSYGQAHVAAADAYGNALLAYSADTNDAAKYDSNNNDDDYYHYEEEQQP